MDELIEDMKVCLATTFAFYLKAHNFHWNVEGPMFPAYHKFFQKIYEDAFDAVDGIAEEIRTLGSFAPGSMTRYLELTKVDDEISFYDAHRMVKTLQMDNERVIDVLRKAQNQANKQNAVGLENFLQDRIDKHYKHNWMLKATLGQNK
jgi:starvation-inducible DNA-binding protein